MANACEDHMSSMSDKHNVAHNEKVPLPPVASSNLIEDPALEARLNRKFDLHVLPWLFGIWYFNPIPVHPPQICLILPYVRRIKGITSC